MLEIIALVLIVYILLFLLSAYLKDNSLADVFWWVWFVIVAIMSFVSSDRFLSQYVLTWLIILWGVRIVSHIWIRKIKSPWEDPRYIAWRKDWWSGWYFYVRSFLQVYILQMILMLVISTAIFIVNMPWFFLSNSQEFANWVSSWLILGTIIALAGLVLEAISDRQLSEFMKVKKPGQIFIAGLYQYSRHPNYFGESMFWLGISIISLQYSYLWLISFFVITFLLLFVSGIPMQEARYAWRPEWEDYKKRTSIFVPWFPKKQ